MRPYAFAQIIHLESEYYVNMSLATTYLLLYSYS